MTQPPYSPFGGPSPVDGPTPQNPGFGQPPAGPQWGGPSPVGGQQPQPQGWGGNQPPQQGGWPGQNQQPQFSNGPQPGGFPPPGGFAPHGGFTPAPPPARNKKALFITVGATAAVLLVVALVVGIVRISGGSSDAKNGGASSAGDAVKGYLEALAKGDASGALAFGVDQPGSKEFLTDDILKQQITKWPITNIRILNANEVGDAGQVHVSVNFGDQTSDQTLMTQKTDDGWKLSAAAIKLNLAGPPGAVTNPATGKPIPQPPITLFGKPVSKMPVVYVFPGWLDVGSASKYLTLKLSRPILLDWLAGHTTIGASGLDVALADQGLDAAKKAVADSVAQCAQSTALAPPNCPNKLSAGVLVDGTVHWDPTVDLSVVQYNFMAMDLSIHLTGAVSWPVSGQGVNGGTMQGKMPILMMGTIDMTQDPLVVTWGLGL